MDELQLLKDSTERRESDGASQRRPLRVLTLSTIDMTLGKLLQPLIQALRESGHVSECAAADGPYAQELRAEGFTVHRVAFKRKVLTSSHLLALVQVYRLLRRRKYDVVHVHTPFAQVIGRIAAKGAGVPIILYTSHGFQFHESRSRLARAAIIAVERWLGRWTDMLFTQSMEDAEAAVRLGITTEERVMWIGNGIQLERYHPGPKERELLAELDLESTDRVIGFLGRVVREKGVLELVEAAAEVMARDSRARLLIVGDTLASDGDTEAKRLVKDAIRKHGIEGKVRFAGLRDDVPRFLRVMDLFVLPSWREGMPRSIIEAMASGLPVVATDIRGCREEVVHGETGLLVPVKSGAALAEALLTLVTDPGRASAMGIRGRDRALSMFDERQVVARQLSAYATIAKTKGLV